MSDENDDKSGALTGEDAALWQVTTKGVKRLPGKKYLEGMKENPEELGFEMGGGETVVPERVAVKPQRAQGHDLDRRTEERLRKGQMNIEGRLDLHGLNQDEAHSALNSFIESAYQQSKRCVLVITGKGKTQAESKDWFDPKPGVLKQHVPEWLQKNPIKPMVLKAVPAQQKDGGDGALYVLLRRQR